MISDVTGILLAGGRSRRMGQDKRFLSVGEESLLNRSQRVLRSVFSRVYIVIAQDSENLDAEVPVLRDIVPGCGSLGGLFTGLKNSETSHVFLASCDMPFLSPKVIQFLVTQKESVDIVIVRNDEGLQSTHALYSRKCLPIIADMIHRGRLRIRDLMNHPDLCVRVIEGKEIESIEPLSQSFMNVNTPADLERAQGQTITGGPCRHSMEP
ncbi:MAG: molybdenum cofactor guanylyltransferase [Nitrospira sp.]|nr:molybdenum cofactor guanylyltransferase [Nitrospira sp.]